MISESKNKEYVAWPQTISIGHKNTVYSYTCSNKKDVFKPRLQTVVNRSFTYVNFSVPIKIKTT